MVAGFLQASFIFFLSFIAQVFGGAIIPHLQD